MLEAKGIAMNGLLRGNAWIFRGLLDIDYEICSFTLSRDLRNSTPEALGEYCMTILGAGVGAVLCESAAPYFLRNSLELGLPVIELPGVVKAVEQGDPLEVDLIRGTFRNLRSQAGLSFAPPPGFI